MLDSRFKSPVSVIITIFCYAYLNDRANNKVIIMNTYVCLSVLFHHSNWYDMITINKYNVK